eukprot:1159081-Pelagomonas_calceolata.AAC.3
MAKWLHSSCKVHEGTATETTIVLGIATKTSIHYMGCHGNYDQCNGLPQYGDMSMTYSSAGTHQGGCVSWCVLATVARQLQSNPTLDPLPGDWLPRRNKASRPDQTTTQGRILDHSCRRCGWTAVRSNDGGHRSIMGR